MFETDDPVEELRAKAREMFPYNDELARATYHWNAADEIARLRSILHAPLSSAEMKLVDKNCDWIAFKHAWNAIVKRRIAEIKP
jgi:hypothetical protein